MRKAYARVLVTALGLFGTGLWILTWLVMP